MSGTLKTDDQPIIYAINDNGYQVPCVDIEYARELKRERDEAREQNAKLQDIAERAIEEMESGDPVGTSDAYRAELDKIKEGAK
jgi:hypothetical protein